MADGFAPPQEVRANAKRGLELRAKYGRGGTEIGVARARDLSNGKSLPIETIRRMVSYFARHEVDKQGEGWGKDSAGYIAWLLWGGDAGKSWANRINDEQNKKDKSMNLDLAYSYAGIIKSEKQSDGTLKVYGKATDDALDVDQQICDETWLKEAMPDWFTSGGNIREQHSNIAAGVATDYEAKADGHYITALIVDPVSVKKVETGVLKGFSIGIRGPRVIRDSKAAGGRIVGGQIVEVSVVDRPANPNAKMVIAKAAESGVLEAVDQFSVPSPADLFAAKSDVADSVETLSEGETVSEEIAVEATEAEVVEAPVEDTPLEGVEVAVEAAEAAPEAEAVTEDVITPEAEIVNAAKSLLATVNKFSQPDYDAAMTAIADLIIVEAGEMKAGSDERDSIKELLRAAKHLAEWYEGEVEAGEVPGAAIAEALAGDVIELSADVVICDDCGEDEKMCKCGSMKSATPEAVASVNLEVDDATMATIIEKAVATAKAAVSEEITLLKSAQEAALQKADALEAELATALTKAAAGGPKRSAAKEPNFAKADEYTQKSYEFLQKAAVTQDKTLAEGYRELAEDFKLKAAKAAGKDA